MCVVIEAAGQALIWLAPQPMLVFAGAALAGLGYALVSGHGWLRTLKVLHPHVYGCSLCRRRAWHGGEQRYDEHRQPHETSRVAPRVAMVAVQEKVDHLIGPA